MDKFSYEEIVTLPIGKIGQDILNSNKLDEDTMDMLEANIGKAIHGASTAHVIMALLHVLTHVLERSTRKVKK